MKEFSATLGQKSHPSRAYLTLLWTFFFSYFYLFSSPSRFTACASSEKDLFYIYDWPNIQINHSHEYVDHLVNNGAGQSINSTLGIYNTDQFQLYTLMMARALRDYRRTLHPENATTFLIPYDLARDAAFFKSSPHHGPQLTMGKCSQASEVIHTLKTSPFFARNQGRDHLLLVGLNYAMDAFLFRPLCKSLLLFCTNCTKLAIDDYSALYPDNEGAAIKGDFWYAVPFPSNFHWTSSLKAPLLWDMPSNRSLVVSYVGSWGSSWSFARSLRKQIHLSCGKHPNLCRSISYAHQAKNPRKPMLIANQIDPHSLLSFHSTFCFIPLGDMHTRKGLFDSLAYGCIPVTFSPLTATNMYTWHWPEHYWKQIVIEIPLNESRSDKGIFYSDPVEYLYNLTLFNMSEIHERQKLLKARVFELQYALEENTALRGSSSSWPVGTVDGRPLKDAYMISMDLVLGWNSGRASRGVANSTVFECWSGGVVVNNRCTKLDATLAPLANTIR